LETKEIIEKMLNERLEPLREQFATKEKKLNDEIEKSKKTIDEQSAKNMELAKLKQDEKKEKEKWQAKYDES
jgi:hypothetical protein